jgi:hypothetical protein
MAGERAEVRRTPTLNQRIAERAQEAVAWVRSISLFVKIVLVAGGALVSGLAKFLPLQTTPVNVQAIVGSLGALAAFLGAVALLFLDKNLAGSLVDAADATAELQRVQAAIAGLRDRFAQSAAMDIQARALRAAGEALRAGLERALLREPPDERATVQELLDLALDDLVIAAGFTPGELWTISVYRAETIGDVVLRRLVTRRANRLEETGASREWGRGEGHIGMAYLRANGVVLEDVEDPAIRHTLNTPPEKDLTTDPQRYRSIAAIGVLRAGTANPWGVVIATSSVAGRFSPDAQSAGSERAEAMRVLAGVIALAISIHDIKIQRVARGSPPPTLTGHEDSR